MKRNILFFTNGSIGDFLMVLFFAQVVHANSPQVIVRIITPRNKAMFEVLASNYPHVSVYESNIKKPKGIWSSFLLLGFMFGNNTVITPSTPGHVPAHIKLFGRTLSLFSGSLLVGFDDHSFLNKYLYDQLFVFNESILYSDSMILLAKNLGFVGEHVDGSVGNSGAQKTTNPTLMFKKDDSVFAKYGLVKNSYVVLHPCGSNIKRTLLPEEINYLLGFFRSKNPNAKIVFTGSAEDSTYIEKCIASDVSKPLNLAGKLSVGALAAIIDSCELFVGVDTGITHLASMMGKKSIVVSHENSVFYWLPYYNENARILYSIKNCQHGVHEGIAHLRSCYTEEKNYLQHVSLDVLKEITFF